MKCPHCLVAFHDNYRSQQVWIGKDIEAAWAVYSDYCPDCKRLILILGQDRGLRFEQYKITNLSNPKFSFVLPRTTTRSPCPAEVPADIAEDYNESCLVLHDSPKASAALSRRCLQNVLRTKGGVKPGDLSTEIEQVLQSKAVPTHIADAIDAVRNIGNFAAHPIKSKDSGSIVPVTPEEAEWNLDVLESLFDFYFVQPATLASRRDRLNAKLQEAGKSPMKG